jgi:hypothetical protein
VNREKSNVRRTFAVPAHDAGRWLNRQQLEIIDYLKEENRVLRERRLDSTQASGGVRARSPRNSSSSGSLRRIRVGVTRESVGRSRNVGHELGRNTIKRILSAEGLEPAPTRSTRMSWKTFLKAHFGGLAATDFFSVEVLTFKGLVRYFVLFIIDLETRCIQIAGIVCQPDGAWMKQVARNVTDSVDGFRVSIQSDPVRSKFGTGRRSTPPRPTLGRRPRRQPEIARSGIWLWFTTTP